MANFPSLGLCRAGLPRHSPLQLRPCIYRPATPLASPATSLYIQACHATRLSSYVPVYTSLNSVISLGTPTSSRHDAITVTCPSQSFIEIRGYSWELCTGFAEHLSHNFPVPRLHLPESSADVDTGRPTHLLHTLPLSFAVAVTTRINGGHTQPNTEVTALIMLFVPGAECSLFSILLHARICLLNPLTKQFTK